LSKQLVSSAFTALFLLSAAEAQERQWSLDASVEDAFLVLGVPETDDIGLSFWCKIGTGSVTLFYPVTWTDLKNNGTVRIHVELGSERYLLRGKASSRRAGSSASLEAELELDSQLFEGVKRHDYIVLRVLGHRAAFPLQDADFDGLINLCRQGPGGLQQ
jgi:hypothetical protein